MSITYGKLQKAFSYLTSDQIQYGSDDVVEQTSNLIIDSCIKMYYKQAKEIQSHAIEG